MTRLRLAYFGSIAVLVVVAVAAASAWLAPRPSATPQIQRGGVQELPDHWVVSYELTNDAARPTSFGIEVAIDGTSVERGLVDVAARGRLGYFYHVQPSQIRPGTVVTLLVYRDGWTTLVDEVSYHLSPTASVAVRWW